MFPTLLQFLRNIFIPFLRVFHPTPEGPTKAQKKAAAITIQRFVPFFVHWLCLFIDLASRIWFPNSVTLLQLFFLNVFLQKEPGFRSQEKLPNRPLPSSKTLTFKMRPSARLSYENEFYLHENEKSFPYQRLSTWPRFDTEARGNSEMAYSPLWKREGNWVELTFAKTSGTVTRDRGKNSANSWAVRP